MASSRTVLDVNWYARPESRAWRCAQPPTAPEAFHRSLPGYRQTPLVELAGLGDELGVGHVLVKDESSRLELPAFKMLGASWAVYRAIRALDPTTKIGAQLDDLRRLTSRLGPITLTTATDGNHGRAVARMAHIIGVKARIFVPGVVDPLAILLIEEEGAEVIVLDATYDETVRRAAESAANDPLAILVQDTSWPGYEEIPQWIVDGYSTMFGEVDVQLLGRDMNPVALTVVPTGVGSLAQAAVAFHRSGTGVPSSLLVVEPDSAACVRLSLQQAKIVSIDTGHTTMDGLNCGTPSSIAWPFLLNGIDAAISVTDEDAAKSSKDLAQLGVSSGPCGAASLAALRAALLGPDGGSRRDQLGLDPESTVVLLNTEGDRRA